MSAVCVYVLHFEGAFHPSSLGALAATARVARQLGWSCDAVVAGRRDGLPDELCASLGGHGAQRVLRVAVPSGLAQPVVDAMDAAMTDAGADHAVLGGGLIGYEAGAGLAARRDAGLCVDAVALRAAGGRLVADKSIFGDSMLSSVEFPHGRGVVVGRTAAFEVRTSGERRAPVEDLDCELSPQARGVRLLSRGERRAEDTSLQDADVVVTGGRGMGGPEAFARLEELADALGGGAVGATRAAVDAGWWPYAAQVGQTGKTVKPRLYVAAGVSGAIQHRVGMEDAEHILAINHDPAAPIFTVSHLGVVGDVHRILPLLTDALRRRRAG